MKLSYRPVPRQHFDSRESDPLSHVLWIGKRRFCIGNNLKSRRWYYMSILSFFIFVMVSHEPSLSLCPILFAYAFVDNL